MVRRQLIGNSFNCCVISFLLQQLLYNKGYLTGYPDYQLCVQVGVAEKPFVDVSNTDQVVYDDILAARQLVTECLRISEKGGSDVRLDLGIPYRPNAWPRAAARPYLWSWEVVHGYPWRESEDTHTHTHTHQQIGIVGDFVHCQVEAEFQQTTTVPVPAFGG